MTNKQLDRVLRYLYNKPDYMQPCSEIELRCKLDKHTATNIYRKLALDGYLKIVKDTYEKGVELVYLKDEGRSFIASSSYTSLYWKEMPKKYWWAGAIFAVISFAAPLYLQYCNKPNQQQPQVEKTKSKPEYQNKKKP